MNGILIVVAFTRSPPLLNAADISTSFGIRPV